MDNTAVVVGATCGAVVIAGTYLFMMSKGGSQSNGAQAKNAAANSKDDDHLDEEKFPAGRMNIYFGSQTGTAASYARTLAKEGNERGFKARPVDLEDFKQAELEQCNLAVFLMATYGEGEPTDNATAFSTWMLNENSSVTADSLKQTSFTVFGLGNRQYENFNKMGKRTNEALERFGAKRVFDYGEGDDDGSLEDDFQAWKTKLWPALVSQFHKGGGVSSSSSKITEDQPVQLLYKVVPLANEDEHFRSAKRSQSSSRMNNTNKHFFTAPLATISTNRELRNGGGMGSAVGSTCHVEIELEGTGLTYQTADNLAVLPENDPTVVAELAKALGYTTDQTFYVELMEGVDAKYDFPSPCTVKDVLTRYFDLQGVLKQNTLRQLVPYVADAQQKDWLKNLLADGNRAAFKKTIQEGGKSICDLLTNGGELSSCKVPLADLLHILPFMQPRYYTISSSSSCHPNTVHITVSVTEFLANGRKLKGLCSSYLQKLVPSGARGTSSTLEAGACRVFVRASSFRLPKQLSTPIVMIGPGTGIAPMRALLQDRKWQGDANGTLGKNTLYFGCQKRTVDYIYKDEIEEYAENKVLTSLQLAFSRETEKKVYVQHLIRASDNAKDIVVDLDQGGYIFVCGATAMGTDVMDAVIDVVASQKALTKDAATEYVRDLQKKGRYVQELWTA